MDETIDTDYGQLDLTYRETGGFDGDWDRFFASQTNGLVGAAGPDGLYLNLARRSGGSRVRIDLHPVAPADNPHWEDVVEVSTTIPSEARVRWMSWAGESSGDLPGLAPGDCRVRVSARGRDQAAADEFADEALDSYLVQLWPALSAAEAVVRTTSADAQYWHDQRDGR